MSRAAFLTVTILTIVIFLVSAVGAAEPYPLDAPEGEPLILNISPDEYIGGMPDLGDWLEPVPFKPDLKVKRIKPDAAFPLELVQINVIIENVGHEDAESSYTKIKPSNAITIKFTSYGLEFGDKCIVKTAPIKRDQTAKVSCWAVFYHTGDQKITAKADTNKEIDEEDEDNNKKTENIRIAP